MGPRLREMQLFNAHSKRYPVTDLRGPRGVQEVKTARFLDTRHMKVVRSSPRPPLPSGISWYLPETSGKIPSDRTGDRSRDLPTSSALTTTLPQALNVNSNKSISIFNLLGLYFGCNSFQAVDQDITCRD